MASTALLGCTGMVGSLIFSTLRSSPSISSIEILARRSPENIESKAKITQHIEKDTSTWAPYIASVSPPPSILFSALATTRAAAGSFQNQYKLEHDLNIELAKAAKAAGTKVYVLISSANASPTAYFAYSKMKGEIEEHIKELGFEHTVILQPGLISGQRAESRPVEALARKIAGAAGKLSSGYLKDPWAQDADVIAKAAISAGLKALNGDAPEKVWVIPGAEIIKLGRTEWKET